LEAVFYVLRTGIQWKALPKTYGAAGSIHAYFSEWAEAGFFRRMRQEGLMSYIVPSRPEVLAREVLLSPDKSSGYRYRTLPFDISYHLGYRIFRWYLDQHMHMVRA
jgi:hypothetical protein